MERLKVIVRFREVLRHLKKVKGRELRVKQGMYGLRTQLPDRAHRELRTAGAVSLRKW